MVGSAGVIRALIVDDEPLARNGLRAQLAGEMPFEVVGEAADGPEAVEKIVSLEPDLVFLDIQMPEFDGFEVVRRVAGRHLPAVVFVSAHDRFALEAFEIHALDYLLKPYSKARLRRALDRVRDMLEQPERRLDVMRLASLLEAGPNGVSADPRAGTLTRFVVRDGNRYLLVTADEVDWIAAAGNYTTLHARGKEFLMRGTLSQLEARLEPARFARIHRSTIVNITRIREILPEPSGDCDVVLQDGSVLRMSRRHRGTLIP